MVSDLKETVDSEWFKKKGGHWSVTSRRLFDNKWLKKKKEKERVLVSHHGGLLLGVSLFVGNKNCLFAAELLMKMMAHFSQTRIVGKVIGQFLHALWWLQRGILDAYPLPHFGQTKVWDENGRDAARSFCLLRFSFAA